MIGNAEPIFQKGRDDPDNGRPITYPAIVRKALEQFLKEKVKT